VLCVSPDRFGMLLVHKDLLFQVELSRCKIMKLCIKIHIICKDQFFLFPNYGAVDRGFETSSPDRDKPKTITLVFVASQLSTRHYKEKEQRPVS